MASQIEELRALLPVLKEKEKQGLILPSFAKATDLVAWVDRGRTLTEKQELFVGRLILRAKRKHKSAIVTVQAEKVDEQSIVDQVLERVGRTAVDVDAVARVVLAEMDRRTPPRVEVMVQPAAGGKAARVDGPQHRMFQHLARAAAVRLPGGYAPGIFLQGEASSGKTTGARMLAEALKLKWHFNGAISFPHEMLGFIDGAGKYHRTPFREAYEHGGVYTFDEVDRSDPVALLAVNPHLANGIATFPDKQVKRHKDCIIVCTANTWGLGADANYSGATKLDAAFLSRFPVRINWDIDLKLEEQIVGNAEWLNRVRAARDKARVAGIKVMIDTRAAQAGAALIAAGYSMDEAASMTYLANMKTDQRALIGEAV
jgi:hypothetical protein